MKQGQLAPSWVSLCLIFLTLTNSAFALNCRATVATLLEKAHLRKKKVPLTPEQEIQAKKDALAKHVLQKKPSGFIDENLRRLEKGTLALIAEVSGRNPLYFLDPTHFANAEVLRTSIIEGQLNAEDPAARLKLFDEAHRQVSLLIDQYKGKIPSPEETGQAPKKKGILNDLNNILLVHERALRRKAEIEALLASETYKGKDRYEKVAIQLTDNPKNVEDELKLINDGIWPKVSLTMSKQELEGRLKLSENEIDGFAKRARDLVKTQAHLVAQLEYYRETVRIAMHSTLMDDSNDPIFVKATALKERLDNAFEGHALVGGQQQGYDRMNPREARRQRNIQIRAGLNAALSRITMGIHKVNAQGLKFAEISKSAYETLQGINPNDVKNIKLLELAKRSEFGESLVARITRFSTPIGGAVAVAEKMGFHILRPTYNLLMSALGVGANDDNDPNKKAPAPTPLEKELMAKRDKCLELAPDSIAFEKCFNEYQTLLKKSFDAEKYINDSNSLMNEFQALSSKRIEADILMKISDPKIKAKFQETLRQINENEESYRKAILQAASVDPQTDKVFDIESSALMKPLSLSPSPNNEAPKPSP